jgi:hypothetical protein
MDRFMKQYGAKVTHILSGFDRLVFRGHLRQLSHDTGMAQFLSTVSVLLKDYGPYAERCSEALKTATEAQAERQGRPVVYLESPKTDKEAEARKIAARDGVTEGLVCVLTSVEPCWTYSVRRDREKRLLVLERQLRKCLFAYHYMIDETFGWMNARIQTWFPFPIQVCLNGREWLARSMDQARLGYERHDNLFLRLEDPAAAQRLMDGQGRTNWATALDAIARRLNPAHETFLAPWRGQYYWTTHQSEWATDLVFDSREELAALYKNWVRAGVLTFGCDDILRFLGKRLDGHVLGEVVGDCRKRQEHVRVRYWYGQNSVKMYDKDGGAALRIETTLNDPSPFKSYRPKEGDPGGEKTWRRMRRGVADLYRRTEVSQAANDRFLNALAPLETSATVLEVVSPVCRRQRQDGRSVRALAPWSPEDQALLACIARGDFFLNGFRNRDVRAALHGQATTAEDQKRQAARVTRLLRLLRAHGLIAKVSHTHRYVLTDKGREIVTAVLQTQTAHVNDLARLAA